MPTVPEATTALEDDGGEVRADPLVMIQVDHKGKAQGQPRFGWFKRLPLALAITVILTWALYIGLLLLKTLSRSCSVNYWVGFALQLTLMAGIGVGVAVYLMRVDERSSGASTPKDLSEQDPTTAEKTSSVLLFEALAFSAGLLGGMLGLGGGVILAPMLLSLGIQAQVSSATTTTIVLLSSSAAMINFATMGLLNLEYAAVFGVAAALASLFGMLYIGNLIKRSGRVSLVVLSLTVVMGAGLIGIAVVGSLNVVRAVQSGNGNWGVSKLCP
jgi:hypothetical protein